MNVLIKDNRAITLIALVITIVVILILAGITIGVVTGDNGIINETKGARTQSVVENEKSIVSRAEVIAKMRSKDGIATKEMIEKAVKEEAGKNETEISGTDTRILVKFVETGNIYIINTILQSCDGPYTGEIPEEKPMIMRVVVSQEDIDNKTNKLKLSLDVGSYANVEIDYGDGEKYTYTANSGKKELNEKIKLAELNSIQLATKIEISKGEVDTAHEYTQTGTYNVYLRGDIKGIYCAYTDILKEITQWGELPLKTTYFIHSGLEKIAGDMPSTMTTINGFSECTALTDITIPNTINTIGDNAFIGCINIENVIIPNSIRSIEEGSFWGCDKISSITIPNSVIKIGEGAFSACNNLEVINVETDNQVYDSPNDCNAIIEKSTNTLIQGCNTTIIPENIKIIGKRAFNGCNGITDIVIPNGVTSIENNCFSACINLNNVELPDSIVSIGYNAFRNCEKLTSVRIPKNLTEISSKCFSTCENLTNVTIPKSVTFIGPGAFEYCKSIKTVQYEGTENEWENVDINSYRNGFLINAEKIYNYKN